MIDKIKCPNCAHQFDVEQALAGKLEAQYRADYEKKGAEQAALLNKERAALDAEKKKLVETKAKENELFMQRIAKEKENISSSVQKEIAEKYQQRLKSLEDENLKKLEENRALKKQELELLKRERDLKEKKEEMEMAVQKQLLEQQKEIEDKGRAKERAANELKEREFKKQLEDQAKLISDLKRKSEQGSMQLQGEVQELAVEELLIATYPFDNIKEVPKGIRGADCIQEVVNATQQLCGTIVYESKRTKAWGGDWISKLKQDQISCKADIAVIITQTLPSDMERFGNKDGVWICGFHEVKSLSFVLREMILRTYQAKSSDTNKADKKELLYEYFSSMEFKQNIGVLMDHYNTMKTEIDSERRSMEKIWSRREKRIWAVQKNLTAFIGSVEGITGNELDAGNTMQLPGDDDF